MTSCVSVLLLLIIECDETWSLKKRKGVTVQILFCGNILIYVSTIVSIFLHWFDSFTVKDQLKQLYHSFSRTLRLSTATPLLIKFPSLRHQAQTEQLVHHTCTRAFGCKLLQDITQNICGNTYNQFHLLKTQMNESSPVWSTQ